MWYDILVTAFILISLVLIIASRITRQTIPEMLKGFMELIRDYAEERKEDSLENYLNLRG